MTIYKAGDILQEAEPFALLIFEKNKGKYCDHCFLKLNKPKRCVGCRTMYYCGQKCAKADWKMAHKFKECKALKENNLLGTIASSLDRDEGPSEYLLDLVTICKFFLRLMLKKKLDPNYNSLFTMADGTKLKYEDMPGYKGSEKMLSPRDLSALSNTVRDLLFTMELPVSDDDIWQLSEQFYGNYELVSPYISELPIGLGVYIYQRSMHSCCSNSEKVCEGTKLTIRAGRDIDTELEPPTICYVDASDPCAKRRDNLFRNYDITCECRRCEAGTEYPDMLDVNFRNTSLQPSKLLEKLKNCVEETRRIHDGGESHAVQEMLLRAFGILLLNGHFLEAREMERDLEASTNIFHGPLGWSRLSTELSQKWGSSWSSYQDRV